MTDKEQIKINGIDYTNALEDYLNDCIVDYCKSAHCDIEMAKDIILFPVAKQIEKLQQEKEKFKQECEELKKKEKYLYDFLTCRYNYGSFRPMWGAYLLKRFFNKNLGDFFNADTYEMSDTILEKEKEIDILNQECEKYEQALDEIEKKCCDVLNGDERILYAYQIRDIINKAKGERDENT